MPSVDLTSYRDRYRDGLLQDTLPFWIKHGLDPKNGGVYSCLARDGSLLDSDKSVWIQGRFAWLLATLYNTVEPREEWLAGALSCLRYLEQHAFDEDDRMFFLLTQDGLPLRKRRYVYSEAFACIAYAACSKATQGLAETNGIKDGDSEAYAKRAVQLFETYNRISFEADQAPPKVDPHSRPSKGLGPLMIGINLAQILRENISYTASDDYIDRYIQEIQVDFCKPELEAVMETVSPKGEIIDHFDGRLLNPGHALEAAWFILHEARHRNNDSSLVQLGVQILDWMWQRGWDQEHGGIYYFRDVDGKPVAEYWHDMKFWWPHNEAIIATLLAYHLTDDPRHLERHALVHEWAHQHFADPKHGEWFGYLHRDGSRSTDLKGNLWKGPFHLPRMQLYCWRLLDGMS
jgi:N-acylglucosamine 2-epimerase